jgi:TRAP-type C4-dicarboxylate transport system substrate-binding protein
MFQLGRNRRALSRSVIVNIVCDMVAIYFPQISKQDHEILKNKMHPYQADSYDQWLTSQANAISGWKAGGGEVIMVGLTSGDFERYAKETGARFDANLFKAVAAVKGHGKLQ